jgi:hypothetical protein
MHQFHIREDGSLTHLGDLPDDLAAINQSQLIEKLHPGPDVILVISIDFLRRWLNVAAANPDPTSFFGYKTLTGDLVFLGTFNTVELAQLSLEHSAGDELAQDIGWVWSYTEIVPWMQLVNSLVSRPLY